MDGGTPTKDPPKRGSLFAARAVSEAVAVVPQAVSHGEPTTTDGERRPLPGAGNQQVARHRTVARAGSRAQGRFRAVAARPGARIVGRFFIRTPPPAQGCPGHANRYSSCFFARSRLTISTKFSAYFGVWGVTKLKHHIRGWPSEQMPIRQGFPHPIPPFEGARFLDGLCDKNQPFSAKKSPV